MYIPFGRRDTGAANPKRCLGNWLRRGANRKDVVIATKVGMPMAPDRKGLSAKHIMHSVEESLRRLQTDYIDLYFSHCDDTAVPMEETLATYQKLISQGKVRAIGASNFTAARMGEALELSRKHALPRYEVLQPHYNLYARADYESALESLCLEHQIGVVSYFALAAGFLTGKYRTPADAAKSARGKGVVEQFLNERGLSILAALDEVGRAPWRQGRQRGARLANRPAQHHRPYRQCDHGRSAE